MHEMGLDAYIFFIAWPRLISDGRGKINPKGLEYYNNLIDALILHGIQPHATTYHFDLPQVIQNEYGGFLSPRFIMKVRVQNISDLATEREVREFFSFSSQIKHVESDLASGRTAYVTFKDPKALEIALHLSVWIQIMMGDIQLLRWAQTQFL